MFLHDSETKFESTHGGRLMHYFLGTLRIIVILVIAMIFLVALTAWDDFFAPQRHFSNHLEHFMQ